MAESVELSLTFELGPAWTFNLARLRYAFEEGGAAISLDPGLGASLTDCEQLLREISEWLQPALELEMGEYRELPHPFAVAGEKFFHGDLAEDRHLSATVKAIHYGSPFEIQLLLPLLTPAGLAGIFYAAKRLYGIDLEFKAYREQRRAEYQEAKKRADQLASPSPKSSPVHPGSRWRLVRGDLRDPDSG